MERMLKRRRAREGAVGVQGWKADGLGGRRGALRTGERMLSERS